LQCFSDVRKRTRGFFTIRGLNVTTFSIQPSPEILKFG
jgi:hypothetical protein